MDDIVRYLASANDLRQYTAMIPAIYQALLQPISNVSGVGQALEKKLHARGIDCLGDLLLHLPKDYIDDRRLTPISDLSEGVEVRIQGVIIRKTARGYGRTRQVSMQLADGNGEIALQFFHSGYMMNDSRLSEGRSISVRGTPERWKGHWQMAHPDWQVADQFVPGFFPKYGSVAGLSGKRVATLVQKALQLLPMDAASSLDALIGRLSLFADTPTLAQSLRQLHKPNEENLTKLEQAAFRLKSEEILIYLHLMRQKRLRADCSAPVIEGADLVERLLQRFPYPLTDAQHNAWLAIAADLKSGHRMHRLLQGDVGAGKTWVAALAMAAAAGDGLQAALLAPTEVLACQHAETLAEYFEPLHMQVGLLTGSTRAPVRRKMIGQLQSGELKFVVGTHALLSDDVMFQHLGLALVDEQHRFGVRQRWALTEKVSGEASGKGGGSGGDKGGEGVHLLGMTATPIPRSLALALYGDMDLSLMRGMPPGRKPVETRILPSSRMKALAEGMQRILDQDGRIYWIVPRIDEDEAGVSVDQRAELLKGYFPDADVRALHGRLKSRDKQGVLDAFSSGSCRILVSTTVVEVGVNVSSARLIVIEQAEQYGLAQLHQLRGRVGRSSEQGYCILVSGDDASPTAVERLRQMEASHDGLELAEADLKLRGAGDAVGTRQSGEAGFRLLDMVSDAALIRQWHEQLPEFELEDAMQRFWRPYAETVD